MQGSFELSELPNGIHIVVVVYGFSYTSLFSELIIPNLGALVEEIPKNLLTVSKVQIFTTEQDKFIIENSKYLSILKNKINVELLSLVKMEGFEKHGNYGPMVMTQSQAVIEASMTNAAIFFVGPDQIYSRGSFRKFIECFQQGYRCIVGPGVRINKNASVKILKSYVSSSKDGTYALPPEDQVKLFFENWHPINDQFVMGSGKDIWWKAYVYFRPEPDELFIRFLQGPTLAAWPKKVIQDFEGFIDHNLCELCCEGIEETYVIKDSLECLALDLTEDNRHDIQSLANFPRADFLKELFDHTAIKKIQLLYGLQTCRVHIGNKEIEKILKWNNELASEIDPLIYLSILERKIFYSYGNLIGSIARALLILNTNFFHILTYHLLALFKKIKYLSIIANKKYKIIINKSL